MTGFSPGYDPTGRYEYLRSWALEDLISTHHEALREYRRARCKALGWQRPDTPLDDLLASRVRLSRGNPWRDAVEASCEIVLQLRIELG